MTRDPWPVVLYFPAQRSFAPDQDQQGQSVYQGDRATGGLGCVLGSRQGLLRRVANDRGQMLYVARDA
jgi:hypothetical protein